MLRLLMIADDFTGALDTGVQLAAHGIPTQVVVGQADLSACSSTVLVVDTEFFVKITNGFFLIKSSIDFIHKNIEIMLFTYLNQLLHFFMI